MDFGGCVNPFVQSFLKNLQLGLQSNPKFHAVPTIQMAPTCCLG